MLRLQGRGGISSSEMPGPYLMCLFLVIPLMVVGLVLDYPKLSLHYWKGDFKIFLLLFFYMLGATKNA